VILFAFHQPNTSALDLTCMFSQLPILLILPLRQNPANAVAFTHILNFEPTGLITHNYCRGMSGQTLPFLGKLRKNLIPMSANEMFRGAIITARK
jgi:hypothetical protein